MNVSGVHSICLKWDEGISTDSGRIFYESRIESVSSGSYTTVTDINTEVWYG